MKLLLQNEATLCPLSEWWLHTQASDLGEEERFVRSEGLQALQEVAGLREPLQLNVRDKSRHWGVVSEEDVPRTAELTVHGHKCSA